MCAGGEVSMIYLEFGSSLETKTLLQEDLGRVIGWSDYLCLGICKPKFKFPREVISGKRGLDYG